VHGPVAVTIGKLAVDDGTINPMVFLEIYDDSVT
jgi:hypothetical protein